MTSRPKLVLHFDVQNTITAIDSSRKLSIAHALNTFLCGIAWGTVDINGVWTRLSDEISIDQPTNGAVSYYKYLEKKLVTSPDKRRHFLDVTRNFTNTADGKHHSQFVRRCLQALRWNDLDGDNNRPISDSNPCIAFEDGTPYHLVFPSVFKLIRHLSSTERQFSIVIRSFGDDSVRVLKAIDYSLRALIGTPLRIPVDVSLGNIQRYGQRGVTISAQDNNAFLKTLDTSTGSERHIYDYISEHPGIWGLKDDYPFWREHGYNPSAGKPFWIDLSDSEYHHIFLDDNLRALADDNIVDLRRLDSDHVTSAVDKEDMQRSCLVQVDMLAAILDENYYVEKLAQCEASFTKLRAYIA